MVFNHDPNWPGLSLGRFRLAVSDDPRAFELEKQLLQITSPWMRLGLLYDALGESDKAREAFAQAIHLAGNDAAQATQAKLVARFEDVFAELLELDPDSAALRPGQARYRATKLMGEEKFAESIELLSSALESFPEDTELLTLRARAYEHLANWPAAIDDYSQVIALATIDGKRKKAERARAVCQIRSGQFQRGRRPVLCRDAVGNARHIRPTLSRSNVCCS